MRTLLVPLVLAASCTCGGPGSGSLVHNTADAFADCSPSEIQFLAAKSGVQLAFGACGSNQFADHAWSPDGTRVYFQLVYTTHVLDASLPHKPIVGLPLPQPIGPATWLSPTRLAVPVGPAAPGTGPNRLALVEVPPTTPADQPPAPAPVAFVDLPGVDDVLAAQAGPTEGEVRLLAATSTGTRAFAVVEGSLRPLLPWLPNDVLTLTWAPAQGAAVVGRGDGVTVHAEADGAALGAWSGATRGTLHPEGRWLVLEGLGEPVSVFEKRSWKDLPPEVAERERARAAELAARLPPGVETTVRPPELSIVDRTTGRRVRVTSFQGEDFAWYAARLPFATFALWGFEDTQVKRNVALVDLTSHLAAVAEGRERLGQAVVEPGTPPAGAPPEPSGG
jgi:hypothetical protein